MFSFLLRQFKRFVVLVPGIAIAYFSVRDIFPYFDRRLPLAWAVFITYVVTAYVLIPAAIRGIRILMPVRHLPLYCVTPDGFASDPINIAVVGSRLELIKAMESAGWHRADPHTLRYLLKALGALLAGLLYHTAPVSSLYLFGRRQDLAFELPVGNRYDHRHHVRFWATTYDDDNFSNIQSVHWHKRREHIKANDKLLWVGCASFDVGISLIRHNFQFTHMIDPNTNSERDLIIEQLNDAGLIKNVKTIQLDEPYRLRNRAWRGSLLADGQMAIVQLRK